MHVEYFFDPRCPWTWLTSRWLVEAGEHRGFDPMWRSFDLSCLDPSSPTPPAMRAAEDGARAVQRLIEALRAQGRNEDAGLVYAEYGTRVHVDGVAPGSDVAWEVLRFTGLDDLGSAIDDEGYDEAVRASTTEALELVGGGVGSPVLTVTTDRRRAMFGPIQAPLVTGARAGKLWDAVSTLIATPEVAEIKRGRGLELPLPPEVRGH